jgi:hypothetical protein
MIRINQAIVDKEAEIRTIDNTTGLILFKIDNSVLSVNSGDFESGDHISLKPD